MHTPHLHRNEAKTTFWTLGLQESSFTREPPYIHVHHNLAGVTDDLITDFLLEE